MTGWLLAEALPYLIGLIGIIGGVVALRRDAVKDARLKDRAKGAEDALAKRRDMDDAVSDSRASGGTWHERLRRNQDKRR